MADEEIFDEVEDVAEKAQAIWWQSKKLVVTLSHHVLTTIGAFTGIILDHSTIPIVLPAWLTSMGVATAGHAVVQGRQDNTIAANTAPIVNPPLPSAPVSSPPAPPPGGPVANSSPSAVPPAPPPPPHP